MPVISALRLLRSLSFSLCMASFPFVTAGCGNSNNFSIPGPTAAPAAPTALAATGGNAQVALTWTAVSNAASYNVYYSATPGVTPATGTKIAGISQNYTQGGLLGGTSYYFVVTAVNSLGESPASNQAMAAPVIPITSTASLSTYIPVQYIAKLYTEALGRAPDQAGWQKFVNSLTTGGCSLSALETIGVASSTFFDSAEFVAANPDPQSQALAMYRAIMSQDPDATSFAIYSTELKAGTSPALTANQIYLSSGFNTLANTICGSGQKTYNPNYGWGTIPVFVGSTLSTGIATYAALTSAISAASTAYQSGKTQQIVTLAQGAVIPLPASLSIPTGVTVETYGTPAANNYTQMARFVRGSSFSDGMIDIHGGGSLQSVWVDGQRYILGYAKDNSDHANVLALGGLNASIVNVKSTDSQGGSNMESDGVGQSNPCTNLQITSNLLTGYSGLHGFSSPTDGMTMYCENAIIKNNAIVDQSDVAIVIMGTTVVGATQHSTIQNNTIISAGISTNAPLNSDVLTANQLSGGNDPTTGDQLPGANQQYPCYEGTTYTNNTFWTGPYTTFDFALEAGGRPFFGTPRLFDGQCADGKGPIYTNNGTGILSANVKIGIAVDGMLNVTITNDGSNPLNVIPGTALFPTGLPGRACPAALVVESAGHSSGSVYLPATSTVSLDSCTYINNGT